MQQFSSKGISPTLGSRNYLLFSLCLGMILSILWITPAQAQEIRAGEIIQITADEVIEKDVYAAASSMTVDGVLTGDLLFAGEKLIVNGTVQGDLWFGGQTLILNGQVEDDLRTGSTAVTLAPESRVGGDLLMGGFSLEAQEGSIIDGNVLFGGYQAILAGIINKDVKVGSGALEIRGDIAGDVMAEVGTNDDTIDENANPFMFMPDPPDIPRTKGGLTIADSASIGGDLSYSSREQFNIPGSSVLGNIEFDQDIVDEPVEEIFDPLEVVWQGLRHWISLLIIGLLLAWLLPRIFRRSADNVGRKPVPSLGWGVVALIATPILLLIGIGVMIFLAILSGFATLESLSAFWVLSGITTIFTVAMTFALVLAFLAQVIVGYGLGRALIGNASTVVALIVGLLIVVLLLNIPYAGMIFWWLIALLGLGAIWLLREHMGGDGTTDIVTH